MVNERKFKQCVPSCLRYIMAGDTHEICVHCLRVEHAWAALNGAVCEHCENAPLPPCLMWQARLVLWHLRSCGSQMELEEELEMASVLPCPSLAGSSSPIWDMEASSAASSTPSENLMLGLSSSEEVDALSIEAGDFKDLPPFSTMYEELLEVVTRAVAKLNVDWPSEKQEALRKVNSMSTFCSVEHSLHVGAFFPDLQFEISRSWKRPFSSQLKSPTVHYSSSILGYEMIPQV